jgi:pimeloyl-ACP methyl ester carboxylesterase
MTSSRRRCSDTAERARLADGVEPSLEALVDGVEAELDRLGLDKVHIAGNSLGGWISLELARRGRARSVVVFSPAGISTQTCAKPP